MIAFKELNVGCTKESDRLLKYLKKIFSARDELGKVLPVDVFVRFYIYFLQNLEAHDLQYKMHALLQFRYDDPRLAFKKFSKRKSPILGENDLRQEMWVPHIFFANEQ